MTSPLERPAIRCKVCGLAVDPKVDVLFGAIGRPLFAAHAGACSDFVRSGTKVVGNTLRGLLMLKAPRAVAMLDSIVAAVRSGTPPT